MGDFCMLRERWQKMRNDLPGQALFIAKAMGRALDDADGVVQSLDAAEREFVPGLAVKKRCRPNVVRSSGRTSRTAWVAAT